MTFERCPNCGGVGIEVRWAGVGGPEGSRCDDCNGTGVLVQDGDEPRSAMTDREIRFFRVGVVFGALTGAALVAVWWVFGA